MDEIIGEFSRRLKQLCSSKSYNPACLDNLKSYYQNHKPVLDTAGKDTFLFLIIGHKIISTTPAKAGEHKRYLTQGKDIARDYRIQVGKEALGLK